MAVTAKTAFGSETKLQRKVQTVAIPLFQFGIFSQGDLDFFAEPPFNFGGRVHTNGNLWLAEFSPSTLTISSKVTAAGELITSNLENGVLTSSGINGPLQITTNPGSSSYANLLSQSPSQSVTGTSNSVGSIGPYNSAFAGVASGVYNGNIGVKETGVKPLNLSIATPNIGGQTIDLIRRPVPGENTSNPAKLSERYYSQVSLRILLSDYGTDGTCNTTDIKNPQSRPSIWRHWPGIHLSSPLARMVLLTMPLRAGLPQPTSARASSHCLFPMRPALPTLRAMATGLNNTFRPSRAASRLTTNPRREARGRT
jgi:hypothetical protein